MAKPYDVKVTVVSQEGECGAGHKVGDSWTVGTMSPSGICLSALVALFPSMRVLRFGGEFPWGQDKETTIVACPDPQNPVVFELRRIK